MIKLSKSSLSFLEREAVIRILDGEYLGMGREVQQFEIELEAFLGRSAVCVNTGTSALQLALEAANIGNGAEVLVPSLTYLASYQAISAVGATPVSCDVLLSSLTIDSRDAESKITEKTKAIMPVHYSGGVGELDLIYALAKKYSLRVIEDAAHAFGGQYRGRLIGSFGDIACFSFDGIKNITSGEGGCVVTNDPSVIEVVKEKRLLGVINDSKMRYEGKRSWEFDVKAQGWRYHMSDVMAAIGRVQLSRFSEFSKKRKLLAEHYDVLLKCNNKVKLLNHDYEEVVPHIYVVCLDSTIDRAKVRDYLDSKGVQTGIHYQPNHKLSFYVRDGLSLPITDSISPRILTLPLHYDLSLSDIEEVCKSLNTAITL